MKKEIKSEEGIQGQCVAWFRNNYQRKGVDKGVVFSVPNEAWAKMGSLKYSIYKTLMLTGMLSGAADLVVLLKERVIFVEMKDHKGKQSPKQKLFEEQVTNLGFKYYLVRNLKDFQKIIESY